MTDGKTYRVRFEYPVGPGVGTERRRTIAYVERLIPNEVIRLRGGEPGPYPAWDAIGVSAITRYFKDRDVGRPAVRIMALTGALTMSGLSRAIRSEIWAAYHAAVGTFDYHVSVSVGPSVVSRRAAELQRTTEAL